MFLWVSIWTLFATQTLKSFWTCCSNTSLMWNHLYTSSEGQCLLSDFWYTYLCDINSFQASLWYRTWVLCAALCRLRWIAQAASCGRPHEENVQGTGHYIHRGTAVELHKYILRYNNKLIFSGTTKAANSSAKIWKTVQDIWEDHSCC